MPLDQKSATNSDTLWVRRLFNADNAIRQQLLMCVCSILYFSKKLLFSPIDVCLSHQGYLYFSEKCFENFLPNFCEHFLNFFSELFFVFFLSKDLKHFIFKHIFLPKTFGFGKRILFISIVLMDTASPLHFYKQRNSFYVVLVSMMKILRIS